MTERARRAEETGARILEAVVSLYLHMPYDRITLRAVAEHAGVSSQTVIRRFGDKDRLVAAAAQHTSSRVAVQRGLAPAGDLPGIVDNLLAHYEEHADLALRLLADEEATPAIATITAMGRRLHRDWCARVFQPWLEDLPEADRPRRLAQVVAVCDVYVWKVLRRDMGLGESETRQALLELLAPLTIGRP